MRLPPSLLAAAIACALAGCAALPGAGCPADAQPAVNDFLYFGTARPGGMVSPQEWSAFLAEVVTPRFPGGLTVWPAAGQWRAADGRITREDAYVLNIVHPRDARSDEALRAIVAAYRSRFAQESVLRVRQAACMTP